MKEKHKQELNHVVGQRLRKIRHQKDLTQEAIAEILNITLAFYGRIERGENGLTLEKIVRLYEVLDIDPTYLLTGERREEIRLDIAMKQCPKEKLFDMEQLIRCAINLSKDKMS